MAVLGMIVGVAPGVPDDRQRHVIGLFGEDAEVIAAMVQRGDRGVAAVPVGADANRLFSMLREVVPRKPVCPRCGLLSCSAWERRQIGKRPRPAESRFCRTRAAARKEVQSG